MMKTIVAVLLCTGTALGAETSVSAKSEWYGASYLHKGAPRYIGEARLLPKLTFAERAFLFVVEGDLRLDDQGYAQGHVFDDPLERDATRQVAGVREMYFELSSAWARLRVGKQLQALNWSMTDTVSPSDNIAPSDLQDIPRWERKGVYALSLRVGNDTYLEGVLIPFFTPTKLPVPGSRWSRELPVGLEYGSQELPETDASQFAFRAGTNRGGWDLALSYYHGYGYSPSFFLQPLSFTTAAVIPTYLRNDVVALSAAGEVVNLNWRFEAGYFRQEVADDFVQLVLGADREWNGVLRESDTLYLLLQYSNEIVVEDGVPPLFRIYDFRRVLSNALITKMRWVPTEGSKWSLNFEGSYNFSDGDHYGQPSIGWKWDSVELTAGLDFVGGSGDTFFGGYGHGDRVFLRSIWYF